MKKICGIYKIISPTNKIYIGQSKNILYRWRYHYKTLHCVKQSHLYSSLKKYGVDKHVFEIIHECLPEECNELEKYYVNFYDTFNSKTGLNLREGGGNKTKFSEESRNKMKKAAMGNTNRVGKFHTQETKDIIREGKRGRTATTETRGRMSNSHLGHNVSSETVDKIKLGLEKNKYTKKIINTATQEIFNSMGDAAKSINKSTQAVYHYFRLGTNIKFNLEYYEKK